MKGLFGLSLSIHGGGCGGAKLAQNVILPRLFEIFRQGPCVPCGVKDLATRSILSLGGNAWRDTIQGTIVWNVEGLDVI